VKATNRDFGGFAARAAQQARIFFLCGQDDAGIQDAAQRLVSLLPDAGERVEMTGAELRKDPVRLDDEARSVSLFGGARHIWVRASGDEAHDAINNLLAGDVAACPVIVLASSATDKSRTAKLLEKRDDSLVAVFWPPDLRAAAASVRANGEALGLRLTAELAERIARDCGLDTRLAQSELTKLALYLDADAQRPRSVDAAALDAVGAGTEEEGFQALVKVVLGGERSGLAGELRRMRELSLNPVGLVLALERRASQLAQLQAKLGPNGDVSALIEAQKASRQIFWKDAPELSAQLRIWRGDKAARLTDRLMRLHAQLMSNSQDGELLLSQALAEICAVAAHRS